MSKTATMVLCTITVLTLVASLTVLVLSTIIPGVEQLHVVLQEVVR